MLPSRRYVDHDSSIRRGGGERCVRRRERRSNCEGEKKVSLRSESKRTGSLHTDQAKRSTERIRQI